MVKQTVADGAIILAGGPSSRMGEPKSLLKIEGIPMLVRVLNALHQSGIVQGIISFKNKEQGAFLLKELNCEHLHQGQLQIQDSDLPFRLVYDAEISQGRNSAVRGMQVPVLLAHKLGWKTVQLAPCDVPFLDAKLPPLLYSKLSWRRNCAAPYSDSGLEPLLICAQTDELNIALNDAHLAAHEVISKMKTITVKPAEWRNAGLNERCFMNVNSAEDIQFIN